MKSLRIGCVKYLNARPLIHGWDGDVVLDHPSALCAQLARGELDLALVSSFEFLRNPIYRIVDDISISSDGPVYSVVVAHSGEISDVKEIELDPAAETSGNLLRCLLSELKLHPQFVARSTWSTETARLLIGDQAIRFRQEHANGFQFFDLGQNWKKVVGLPFVYALWLVRPEVVHPKSVADRLRVLRAKNLANIDKLIAGEKEFDPAFCGRYYCEHLQFNLGKHEKKGLRAFHDLCQKHELLPKRELAFNVV
ncbi:MAG TPA: menaquinone biosynthesis protein [Chthoniobacterales bacterium]|nr:menaquinone biosynthesis protein [Chthoniobacterales bacterium]